MTKKPEPTPRLAVVCALLAVLVAEVCFKVAMTSGDDSRKDAFMMPCVQHQDVKTCLAAWEKTKP